MTIIERISELKTELQAIHRRHATHDAGHIDRHRRRIITGDLQGLRELERRGGFVRTPESKVEQTPVPKIVRTPVPNQRTAYSTCNLHRRELRPNDLEAALQAFEPRHQKAMLPLMRELEKLRQRQAAGTPRSGDRARRRALVAELNLIQSADKRATPEGKQAMNRTLITNRDDNAKQNKDYANLIHNLCYTRRGVVPIEEIDRVLKLTGRSRADLKADMAGQILHR